MTSPLKIGWAPKGDFIFQLLTIGFQNLQMTKNKWVSLGLFHPEITGVISPLLITGFPGPHPGVGFFGDSPGVEEQTHSRSLPRLWPLLSYGRSGGAWKRPVGYPISAGGRDISVGYWVSDNYSKQFCWILLWLGYIIILSVEYFPGNQ